MSYTIAVDVGGTQIRAACYPPESIIPVKIERSPTRCPDKPPLECMFDLIRSVWPEDQDVEAIGVAAPGPLNPYTGVIAEAPNIPGWINLPLRQYTQERFKVPVAVGNDANLAALAEWKYGVGRGHHHLVYLTVSTGIGGGVIIDDKLLLGTQGLAAELGHITVLPGGPMCGCGHPGHLEALSSGTGIVNWVKEEIEGGIVTSLVHEHPLTAAKIAAAARNGDELAMNAFTRAGSYLGLTIANFLHIFNPTIVVIGGGVSQSGNLLLDPMRSAMQVATLSPQYLENLTITTAALGDEVGLIGALALAHSFKG